jgi:hypothetical protein
MKENSIQHAAGSPLFVPTSFSTLLQFPANYSEEVGFPFVACVRDCPTAGLYIRLLVPIAKGKGGRHSSVISPRVSSGSLHALLVFLRVYASLLCDLRNEDGTMA